MLLESVEALNFRNLQGGIRFSPELNILVGENGQGKTNWLEAIAVLASTRSFRTAQLKETINFDQQAASIKGDVRESPEIGSIEVKGLFGTGVVVTRTLSGAVPKLSPMKSSMSSVGEVTDLPSPAMKSESGTAWPYR